MKHILLFVLFFTAMSLPAQKSCLTEIVEENGYEVRSYKTENHVERREYITPYMTEKESRRRYADILRTMGKSRRYTRLNGGKTQVLFMIDGDINKNVLVARLKSVRGFRIIFAYDEYKEE